MNKIRVALLFGGQSAEHEVSIHSAHNIINSLNPDRYEVLPIHIDPDGRWLSLTQSAAMLQHSLASQKHTSDISTTLLSTIGTPTAENLSVDVVFPVLHGPFGEDGTIQGLLKLTHLPFVGAGVVGSAIGMDKDVMKRLLRDAGFEVAQFVIIHSHQAISQSSIIDQLGLPLFVKPANLGSSVGMAKVTKAEDLARAIETAFRYDRKVILEAAVVGREIECAVLGNEDPVASIPGEVIPHHDFYSYQAKYLDKNGAELKIPANLSPELTTKIQQQAINVFKTLCCEGMARVDFFVTSDDKIIVNEINTIPGFTDISMYPMLWQHSGLSYADLLDRLIDLAINRHKQEQKLITKWSESA